MALDNNGAVAERNIFQNCGMMSNVAGRYAPSIHLFDLFGFKALKVTFDLLGCSWPQKLV